MNQRELKRRRRAIEDLMEIEEDDQLSVVPKDLWVGPIAYAVEVTDQLRDHSRLGATWPDQQLIQLNPQQGAARLRETLVHEVLHTITHAAGFRSRKVKVTEEDLVARLAPVLLDVLRTNRDLVFYLLSHTKG